MRQFSLSDRTSAEENREWVSPGLPSSFFASCFCCPVAVGREADAAAAACTIMVLACQKYLKLVHMWSVVPRIFVGLSSHTRTRLAS